MKQVLSLLLIFIASISLYAQEDIQGEELPGPVAGTQNVFTKVPPPGNCPCSHAPYHGSAWERKCGRSASINSKSVIGY